MINKDFLKPKGFVLKICFKELNLKEKQQQRLKRP